MTKHTDANPRRQPPQKNNWYACKGITLQNGTNFKNGKAPRCFGYSQRIKDLTLLESLNSEVLPKREKKLNLHQQDFVHGCIGTSHYRKNVNMKGEMEVDFARDLARCRAGVDFFSTESSSTAQTNSSGQIDAPSSAEKSEANHPTYLNETTTQPDNSGEDRQGISAKKKNSQGGMTMYDKRRQRAQQNNNVSKNTDADADDIVIDLDEELHKVGAYVTKLGAKTVEEMKHNAEFVRENVFSSDFPRRYKESSIRIAGQFVTTLNNCKVFAGKLARAWGLDDDGNDGKRG